MALRDLDGDAYSWVLVRWVRLGTFYYPSGMIDSGDRFGLWIWSTAPSFGPSDCHELNASMKIVVLGKSVNPLGWLRIFIIVLCELASEAFYFYDVVSN